MTGPDAQQERAGRETGRALDIEVQRVVFGAKRIYCRNGESWVEDEAKHASDRAFYIPSDKPWKTHHIDARPVPGYSTDWNAARLVVEMAIDYQFWSGGGVFEDHSLPIGASDRLHVADLWFGKRGARTSKKGHATGSSLPLAICRAAIAALGTRDSSEVGGDR